VNSNIEIQGLYTNGSRIFLLTAFGGFKNLTTEFKRVLRGLEALCFREFTESVTTLLQYYSLIA
jgi:hypothetical protein